MNSGNERPQPSTENDERLIAKKKKIKRRRTIAIVFALSVSLAGVNGSIAGLAKLKDGNLPSAIWMICSGTIAALLLAITIMELSKYFKYHTLEPLTYSIYIGLIAATIGLCATSSYVTYIVTCEKRHFRDLKLESTTYCLAGTLAFIKSGLLLAYYSSVYKKINIQKKFWKSIAEATEMA